MKGTEKKITIFFTLMILFFLIATSAWALSIFLFGNRTEEIKLLQGDIGLKISTTEKKHEERILIPATWPPIFNKKKYIQMAEFQHKIELDLGELEIDPDQKYYISANIKFISQNFPNPENHFIFNTDYNYKQKPLISTEKPVYVNYKIQQSNSLKGLKDPKLYLTCDYEVVDANGKGLGTGGVTITQSTNERENRLTV